ncbi:MAG: lipocalin-like domain-containing protein [Vicinamibacterales bacterium]
MSKLLAAAIALALGTSQAASPKPQAPWKQATAGYKFEFPRDHASHPDYKIEWWYYTGNVMAQDGRRFGYQVTFFRVGVDAAPTNPSRWAIRDLFMTHLAVSDPNGRRYRYSEKLTRGGPGLAGAEAGRYHVWNEDWTASLDDSGRHVLQAQGATAGIDLVLEPGKPAAINGINGISQKGAQPGNASHYYSLTRMPTRGSISVDGERFEVEGESWMDHEFGTSFLEPEQRGWDWFAIQLSDGRELMLYQLRRADGSRDPRSSGTLVDRSGKTTHLANADFTLTKGSMQFKSTNGAVYPTEWTVAIPSQRLDLKVTTPLNDQELSLERSTGIAYWEGMIDVTGTANGHPVTGAGYLEMTGYHGSLGRVLSGR